MRVRARIGVLDLVVRLRLQSIFLCLEPLSLLIEADIRLLLLLELRLL